MLSETLTRLGFKVVEAGDGQEGWEQLQQIRPDLIMTDVLMPNLNGYDLIRLVRQSHRFSHIPIVAVSASAYAADRQKVLAAGCDQFLTKPIDFQRLLQNKVITILYQWSFLLAL